MVGVKNNGSLLPLYRHYLMNTDLLKILLLFTDVYREGLVVARNSEIISKMHGGLIDIYNPFIFQEIYFKDISTITRPRKDEDLVAYVSKYTRSYYVWKIIIETLYRTNIASYLEKPPTDLNLAAMGVYIRDSVQQNIDLEINHFLSIVSFRHITLLYVHVLARDDDRRNVPIIPLAKELIQRNESDFTLIDKLLTSAECISILKIDLDTKNYFTTIDSITEHLWPLRFGNVP